MQQFTIEHRRPKQGETYLHVSDDGISIVPVGLVYGEDLGPRDVLVPVAPAWPDKPVIVIDEGVIDTKRITFPTLAILLTSGPFAGDYVDPSANTWQRDKDVIESWHEYVPERVEYTADDLDNLPAGGCFWDDGDYVWQKIEGVWKAPDRPIDGNPLLTGTITHAYSAPEPATIHTHKH